MGKKTVVAEHLLPGRRKGDLSAQMVIFCKSLRDLLGSFTSIRSWGEAEEQRSAIATMPSLSHRMCNLWSLMWLMLPFLLLPTLLDVNQFLNFLG